MKNVGSEAHQLGILGGAVGTLAIHDGAFKHVAKLLLGAQVVGPHKVHHAPVLQQVVLQWIPCQHYASSEVGGCWWLLMGGC